MQTGFQIGNFSIHWYGLIFAFAVAVAYSVINKLSFCSTLSKKHIEASLYIALIFGIFGARFYHVADQWAYYSVNLIDIIKIWQGGIGIYGGLFGGLIGILFYSFYKKFNPLLVFDLFSPAVLLAQAIGRWGNYFNQEAYGSPSNLPWAIKIDAVNRLRGFENFQTFHPTFLYESILAVVASAILIIVYRKNSQKIGLTVSLYLISYGLIRLFVEKFRIDTWQEGGIKIAQIISLLFVFAGIVMLILIKKNLLQKKVDKI